jgi:16S rRNA (cytosine1402-N4)-methyltransferase
MRHNIDEAYNKSYVHMPIFWREILEFVEESPNGARGTFVDCTCGEGGHTEMILSRCEHLNVIAFERDPDILEVAKERLAPFEGRVRFINDNFSAFEEHIDEDVQFVLYDFGISSYHFDESARGFTFKEDEPLDMRLDVSGKSAKDLVNELRQDELSDLIYLYGEERWSRNIAKYIVGARGKKKIETTGELADIVLRAIPHRFHVKNIHPATRTFQALRIAVNNELEAIEKTLKASWKSVVPEGRIMCISFHSLEDRIAKNEFRFLSRGCQCYNDPKHCMCRNKPFVKILTKKPLVPLDDEIEFNKRSRSARLRVVEKL